MADDASPLPISHQDAPGLVPTLPGLSHQGTAQSIKFSHIYDLARGFLEADPTPKVSTGLSLLDKALGGGVVAGSIYVLAGRPGAGKTSVALSIARRMAFGGGKKVVFLSLEMNAEELVERAACQTLRVPSETLKAWRQTGELSTHLAPFLATCQTSKFKIIDDSGAKPQELSLMIDEIAPEDRPDVLVIDHLQHQMFTEGLSRADAIANYLTDLKELVRKYQIICFVCSQINRAAVAEKKPRLHNLKSSGAIEEVGDAVLLCTKQSLEDDKLRVDQQTEPTEFVISIAKHRRGPVTELTLLFHPAYYDFEEPEGAWHPQRKDTDPIPVLDDDKEPPF